MSCGIETEANTLLTQLIAGEDFAIPQINLDDPLLKVPATLSDEMYAKVEGPTIEDLTSGEPDGSGVFDVMMGTVKAHMREEFEKGRITGAEYTKLYVAMTQAALSGAIQFTLGQAQAFWQAQQAQIAAVTARAQLEQAKLETVQAQFAALRSKADYATSKAKLSSESIQYCIQKFNLEQILPAQKTGQDTENQILLFKLGTTMPLESQILAVTKSQKDVELATIQYNLANVLPEQTHTMQVDRQGKEIANLIADYTHLFLQPQQMGLLSAQRSGQELKNASDEYTKNFLLPMQLSLLTEQANTARAQTFDNRLNGEDVLGTVGAQKKLYEQQIESYKHDSMVKGAKIFTDAWSVQKTVDENLPPPDNFSNASLNVILANLKTNLNLA